MNSVTVRSFAKVNLTLDVLGRLPDGYHAIESVMQTIGLHDTVRIEPWEGIRVSCDAPGIPTDGRNLAHKAATVFYEAAGIEPGASIHIEKRIPVQAGLGGGSSNAAAVLSGLARAHGIDRAELLPLAAKIGSDVSFFLVGGTAHVRGRGEEVRPLPDIPEWEMLIVKPPFGVSTPWAYRRLDELGAEPGRSTERMLKCIETGCPDLPALLGNDFEGPAVEAHPEIREIEAELLHTGAKGALLCGSGSAVFGLFAGEAPKLVLWRTFRTRTITRAESI
ncbi:MAG: 4-(cytidine 5'-diphospho)-2-C-methyl-D-erythritol kinase [Armatimonadota bacterium]